MNPHEGMEEANASEALSRVIVAFCLGCCCSVFHPNWIRHFKTPVLMLNPQPTLFLPPRQLCASVAGQQASNFHIRPNIQIKCRDFLSQTN